MIFLYNLCQAGLFIRAALRPGSSFSELKPAGDLFFK